MESLLKYLNNFFYNFGEYGQHEISFNKITVKGVYYVGQYVKIVGSCVNDGVYQVLKVDSGTITLVGELSNEAFTGTIFSLGVPGRLKEISEQIQEFNRQLTTNGFASESFGDYSYTKATNANGELVGWKDIFKDDLRPYRKIKDSTRGVKMI